MSQSNFDLVVIGAGPGGYVAAIRASQLGMKTAIIERENLGGICLNWGCIPTKALLRSAEMYSQMKHAKKFGLSTGEIGFDLGAIVKRSRNVSKKLTGGVGFLMKKNKITVIEGEAKLTGAGSIEVTSKDGSGIKPVNGKAYHNSDWCKSADVPGAGA